MTDKLVYFDNAATTPLCEAAQKKIIELLPMYGNASSHYSIGFKAKEILENARRDIEKCINAEPNSIYFTSGASESNTWAIEGTMKNFMKQGFYQVAVACSEIEHHALLNAVKAQESYLTIGVDSTGSAHPEDLEYLLSTYPEVKIVSVMTVNNEIGTIEDIKTLSKITHAHNCLFHTDATQAIPHMIVDVKGLGVDMMSFSGHKFGAPKGIGGLYVNPKISMPANIVYGGEQEKGYRPGTEDIIGAASMAEALKYSQANLIYTNANVGIISSYLKENLLKISGLHINSPENAVSATINFRIDGIEGETLMLLLDMKGICVSAGSACNSNSLEPSHVLKAIGLTNEQTHESVRVSIGPQNTMEETEYFIQELNKIVENLRKER